MTYQVQEFAALAGVTARTLRHYESLGLLKPLRTATRYRVYSEKDLDRLEQVVALKFLGLPLKEIKRVLDRGIPLSETLAEQRSALQEKRQLLDRAINAIRSVESVLASGKRPDKAILRQLIEVIAMQNHLQTMKQYYSEEAWEKLTRLRQVHQETQGIGISEAWKNLFREAESLLGESPASEKVQDLCARWLQLWQSTTGGDTDVVAGIRKFWSDRANWPPEMQRLTAEFDVKTMGDFIVKALAASMKKYYTEEAWALKTSLDQPHFAQAWKGLYQEVGAALNEDPASARGHDLAKRWCQLWETSTQGDAEIQAGMKRAWEDRTNWPAPFQHHMAESKVPQIIDWIGKAIGSLRAEEQITNAARPSIQQ